jgi:uncharacterized protein (DUF1800 family)
MRFDLPESVTVRLAFFFRDHFFSSPQTIQASAGIFEQG